MRQNLNSILDASLTWQSKSLKLFTLLCKVPIYYEKGFCFCFLPLSHCEGAVGDVTEVEAEAARAAVETVAMEVAEAEAHQHEEQTTVSSSRVKTKQTNI